MIVCVCLSPAWDVTYHVDRLVQHGTNRASSVTARAGGKAVNVARVLHTLREPVTVVAPFGGPTGQLFRDDLRGAGVPLVAVEQEAETRRTVSIVSRESADATVVTEPSRLPDWAGFLSQVDRVLAVADLLVISGAVPGDVPVDAGAELTRHATAAGVPSVVDTSGPALTAALAAGPTLVTPNLAELREVAPNGDPPTAAHRLAAAGSTVAVSLGADGLLVVHNDRTWWAHGDAPLRGNPTGAGDAVVAAFARGLRAGSDWAAMAADAVALSRASVLAPVAGAVDLDHYREQARAVIVVARPAGSGWDVRV